MDVRLGLMVVIAWAASAGQISHRPQKLAAVRAHSILPESFRWIVKKHGSELFRGIDAGMDVDSSLVSLDLIEDETDEITALIDNRAPFQRVVWQMGYVSGLLAHWLDPSLGRSRSARLGFNYYMNVKLPKFLFVFDGYENFDKYQGEVSDYLNSVILPFNNYGRLLELHYARAEGNYRFPFDERSPVFGVCAIYFSSLARCSAQLWRHAWASARGDENKMPFESLAAREPFRSSRRSAR